MVIRELRTADWPQVAAIFAEGIATGNATFETAVPDWAAFDASRLPHLRLVAVEGSELLGWTAASAVSSRRAYAGVVEHAVYVAGRARGRGVGRALLSAMVRLSEAAGVWTLRSGVFPENSGSRGLHRALGFRELGRQEQVGMRDGRWRDVVLVERRSTVVGDARPLVRLAGPQDLDGVQQLLRDAGLPTAGLVSDAGGLAPWRMWVADTGAGATGGELVGAAALERYPDGPGSALLLRSVVVADRLRGSGLGSRLVSAALTTADLHHGGAAPVGLLTETADGWFDRFGFAQVPRDGLPSGLCASAELGGAVPACSTSARAYLRPGLALVTGE